MKFRALNLDYHAEATFRLWEQREKEPRVIIRLLGPEAIALVLSNKDGDGTRSIGVVCSSPDDAALHSLQHKEEDSSTITYEPACIVSSMIEASEIMIDITEHQESQEITLVTNNDGDNRSIVPDADAALHSLQHKEENSSTIANESAYDKSSIAEESEIMIDITEHQESHEGVEILIAEKASVILQHENVREHLVQDPTTFLLQQREITKLLECIRLRTAIKRIANEPWSESIRIQSRPPETPMLPFFPSICCPWNVADHLALPTLVGPRLMESILQSHSSFLRIEYRPPTSLPILDSSQYSFSLLNTLQGKGGNFGLRRLGIGWEKTLKEDRAPSIPLDQDTRALALYQGPTATVQSETVVPAEWIVALSLAMAAIQHNIAIPGAQNHRPDPSSSLHDQRHGAKRKQDTQDQLDHQQPTAKQFFLAKETSKTKENHEEKSADKMSNDETRSSKVTFAQAVKRLPNSYRVDPEDVARDGGKQLPGPISEQGFAEGVATADDTAGRPESSRKRDRKERKMERQEKRARKKAKKLEKKRKRSESCEHQPQEGFEDCNVQLPEAKDRRKAPPGSLLSAVTESHQPADTDPRNAMSLQFVEQELDKARTTLLKKARERSREAISSSGIPRATLPSTYDRAPSRPAPATFKRSATATHTAQNTRNSSQHQPSTSASLLQQQRNDSFGWNREMAPDRKNAPVENPQVSELRLQDFQAPQHVAGNDSCGWNREMEPDRKIAAAEAPQVSEVRLQGFRSRQQGAGNQSIGWNRVVEPERKIAAVEAPQVFEAKLQAPQQGAVLWSWPRAQEGNGLTQPAMAPNPNVFDNTHRMHPGLPPEQDSGSQPPQGHEMNFQQDILDPPVSNVAGGRSKHFLQQGFTQLATNVDNSTPQAAPDHHQRLSTSGGPGGASGYDSVQGGTEDMSPLSQENLNTDQSRLPTAKVLCSEEFIESWGDVVAELASGRWTHSFPANDGPNEVQTERCSGRKVELRDTPLVDQCGIDIELSNRCAILLYNISTLEAPQQAREVVIGLAQLVAIGRYKHVCVILCYDVPVTSSITRHIVQLQTAVMSSDGKLSTSTFFKTASPATLSATIAQTVFVHNQVPAGPLSEPPTDVVTDEQIGEWSRFLLSLLPTLSAHGAIQCIQLAQQIAPSGPSFGLLFQSAHARQQIAMATTSNPCRAPAIHPHTMAQLSHILRASLGKSAHQENGVAG